MKKKSVLKLTFLVVFFLCFASFTESYAQGSGGVTSSCDFWNKVQFGGGLGLGIGNGYTNVSVSPTAIYNFNEYVAAGAGIQYSYISQKDFYNSHLYGASAILLVNPIQEIQLSGELEQLRVNSTFTDFNIIEKENFWNTALFVGAGYRSENVTIGVKYNVLHQDKNRVYTTAFMPFVRIFF